MQVGVFLISPRWPGRSDAEALAETLALARLADELGYDDVWLAEHHFSEVTDRAVRTVARWVGRAP
jgi:alkanesulfonate monooxygenase SsuD/methylene tetrahydromethanopterin reductase-like flavin-dependent oxidoreductase (luciferase family)